MVTSESLSPRLDLVVIGASAGGVEAVGKLLRALPAEARVPIIVVMHVPPDRPTLLPALFAERCVMAVKEADDKEVIVPGTVYLAPPNYHLLIEPDGSLSLSVEEAVLYSRPSIDLTMESAAYCYREHVLGIVLTGASSDGARGLAQLRAMGGHAWVQTPAQAVAAAMPQAAIDTAGADCVLSLDDMALALARACVGQASRQGAQA